MARTPVKTSVRWWPVAPAIGLAVLLLPLPEAYVEQFYSRDLYPWLQRGLTALSNLVRFSILDVLLVLGALGVLYRLIRLVKVAFATGPIDALWEGIRRSLRFAGVVLIVFLLVWGLNYKRVPLRSTLPAAPAETAEALEAVIMESNALAARLRGQIEPELTFEQARDQLEVPMGAALAALGREPLSPPGRPKSSVLLTPYFTMAGVNGMLNPFVLESVVHPGLLPIERPFVLAHEWAHLAGQGSEAEANAVGWLACLKGGPTPAYSASIYLIMEAASRLPDQARTRVLARLDPGVRADIGAISRRMLQHHPQVQRVASRVYEEYLQANGVKDGVADYGLALRLILSPPLRQALTNYGKQTPVEGPLPAVRPDALRSRP